MTSLDTRPSSDRTAGTRMARAISDDEPFVASVLHPTDRSEASLSAFYHALAITAQSGANLTLLQPLGRRSTDSFSGLPGVRSTIAKWRRHGATASIEDNLSGSRVSRVDVRATDPIAASLRHLSRHDSDMVVLGIDSRKGTGRLVKPSRAQRLARLSGRLSLFLPFGCRPFVSGATGEVRLRRILIPFDADTDPRSAMTRALQSASLVDDPALEIILLQMDTDDETIMTDLPRLPFCSWTTVRRSGSRAKEILGLAEEVRPDVIYVPTGSGWPAPSSPDHGVLEALLRAAPCPVATVPVDLH